MKLLLKNRTDSIRILSCLFLIVGILMSFKLWLTDRTFPLLPISDNIPQLPIGLDFIVIILLLMVLAFGVFFRQRAIFIAILAVILVLFLQDQMRWQPWVYIYIMLIVPFAFKVDKTNIITYFQILLIGIYLWGGVHKFSADFIDNTFKMILIDMFGVENNETILKLSWLGYSIPIIELLVALFLIIPKTRLLGIIGAILTHVFIFILLIKIDSNTILYPWNIAMILFVIVLFYKNTNKLNIWKGINWQLRTLNSTAIILFIIMPVFALFNMWDNYPSFRLFSGKTNLFYISIKNEDVPKIDPNLNQYFWNPESLTRGKMISLNAWTVAELNVPFYPETRVFKQFAKTFCDTNTHDDYLIFVEFDRGFKAGDFTRFKCSELD